MVVAVLVVSGCAGRGVAAYEEQRATLTRVDDFNLLLLGSGVRAQALAKGDVTEAEAQRLLGELRYKPELFNTFGPRRVAEVLLWEVFASGESATREEMNRRLARYEGLVVMTPEGLMTVALTGEVVEWVGRVEVVKGLGQARGYTVGGLYTQAGGAGWRQVEWTEGWAERMVAQGAAASR